MNATTAETRPLVDSLHILLTLEQEHERASHCAAEWLGRTYGSATRHVCAAIDEIWIALKDMK